MECFISKLQDQTMKREEDRVVGKDGKERARFVRALNVIGIHMSSILVGMMFSYQKRRAILCQRSLFFVGDRLSHHLKNIYIMELMDSNEDEFI